MIVSKIIVCPTCGTNIYVRIQKGDYIPRYPIRINCGKCRSLIKGVYYSDEYDLTKDLYLVNGTHFPCCGKDLKIDASYEIEISGELPCKMIKPFDGKGDLETPFSRSAGLMESHDVELYIKRLERFSKDYLQWIQCFSTAFQLLIDGNLKYIPNILYGKIGYEYNCDNYVKTLHSIYEVALDYSFFLFEDLIQETVLKVTIQFLSELSNKQMMDYCNYLNTKYDLVSVFKRLMNVFSDFMTLYPNLLPAEAMKKYKDYPDSDLTDIGISTCTYIDIKSFYQDSYETLLSLMEIPVCLDNIYNRKGWNNFVPYVVRKDKKSGKPITVNNIDDYNELANGKRLEFINNREYYQGVVRLPANSKLRNGIGHNNIYYDGVDQSIHIFDRKNNSREVEVLHLMDMAKDCLDFARSAIVMANIVLFLIRQQNKENRIRSIISPRFYSETLKNSDKCPCGSGMSYGECCKQEIEKIKLITS